MTTRVDELDRMLKRASSDNAPLNPALRVAIRTAKRWKKLPPGWTDESVKKFWEHLTSAAPKHKVTECIKQMEGKFENPGAFCGGLADEMIPGWRQESAKERAKTACDGTRCQCGDDCQCGGSPLSLQPDYGTGDAAVPRADSVVERYARKSQGR